MGPRDRVPRSGYDLWAELLSAREAPGSSYVDAENAPLTAAEQAQVVKLLAELKEDVGRTYALTEAQLLALEVGFDEVREAVAIVGRRHLRLIVGGVILDMIREALLPREAVLHVLVIAFRGLDGVLGGGAGGRSFPGRSGFPLDVAGRGTRSSPRRAQISTSPSPRM